MIDISKKPTIDFSATPSIPPVGIDLWLLDLSKISENISTKLSGFFSAEELIRAQKYKRNSNSFLATRALLRLVLAKYTGLHPQDLLFASAEHGKPYLINSPLPVYFNLSHCGDVAVLAVGSQDGIGVDIEIIRARDYLSIAERFFHDDEWRLMNSVAAEKREILFFKLWTLKEAFFKAMGGGISTGLDKAYFQFDRDIIKVDLHPELAQDKKEWQFHQEFIAANIVVALAARSTQPIKHQWLSADYLFSDM